MLKWPKKANIAIQKLFAPLQEIDVYVEDSNDEPFYRALLNAATQEKIKIARVFALEGRTAVIEAAKNHNHKERRALFIIDGDLSWVKGEPAPKILNLHRHDAYCIENLLLCERALSQILSQEAVITEDIAIIKLNYQNWLKSIEQPLLELFSAFATVHTIDPTIRTVSNGVGILCNQCSTTKKTILDEEKVKSARDEALNAAKIAADPGHVLNTYQYFFKRLQSLANPLYGVSGKDYLLPLINFHLQSFGCRIKRKSLRVRLACSGNLARFSPLANALSNAARGTT